ncbi:MAG: vWA domain-containing protein [Nannocystaceae bacterium]
MSIARTAPSPLAPALLALACACTGGDDGPSVGESTASTTSSASASSTSLTLTGADTETATTSVDPSETSGPCLTERECGIDQICVDGVCVDVFCGGPPFDDLTPAPLRARALRCASCDPAVLNLLYYVPEVVFVVAKSGSMGAETLDHEGDPDTPPVSRWSLLKPALTAFVEGHEASLRGGLVFQPGLDAQPYYDVSACPVAATPEVIVAPGSAAEIVAALQLAPANLAGATPTRAALELAVDHLSGTPEGPAKAIVLLTDAAANCDPDAADEAARFEVYDDGVLEVAAAALAQGIPVHVIGVAAPTGVTPAIVDGAPDGVVTAATLASLAAAGGGLPFVNATTPDALDLAFAAIAEALLPCHRELDPPPAHPDYVEIQVDGVDLVRSDECADPTGWHYTDDTFTRVEFCADACAVLRLADDAVAHYECPPGL